jgi:hypothetical protein
MPPEALIERMATYPASEDRWEIVLFNQRFRRSKPPAGSAIFRAFKGRVARRSDAPDSEPLSSTTPSETVVKVVWDMLPERGSVPKDLPDLLQKLREILLTAYRELQAVLDTERDYRDRDALRWVQRWMPVDRQCPFRWRKRITRESGTFRAEAMLDFETKLGRAHAPAHYIFHYLRLSHKSGQRYKTFCDAHREDHNIPALSGTPARVLLTMAARDQIPPAERTESRKQRAPKGVHGPLGRFLDTCLERQRLMGSDTFNTLASALRGVFGTVQDKVCPLSEPVCLEEGNDND